MLIRLFKRKIKYDQIDVKAKYTLKYKYKLKKDTSLHDHEFKCVVSYKVLDDDGNKILSRFKKSIICGFDNFTEMTNDEINPLYGLTYDDLNDDLKKQIIQKSLRELITIDYKLLQYKWSSWEEIPIEIV